jgi:hypothetical protein
MMSANTDTEGTLETSTARVERGYASARVEPLAREYDQLLKEVLTFCEGCSDAEWNVRTAEEGWPVGAVAHHMALGAQKLMLWTRLISAGEETGETAESIHAWNALESARHSERPRSTTLALLRETAAEARGMLQDLNDGQLDRTAMYTILGERRTAERMAQSLVGHMRGHFEHMRAAVSATGDH